MLRISRLIALPLLLGALPARADGGADTPHLFMPDGQLRSHSVRVYVTRELDAGERPRLRLVRSHAVTKRAVDESKQFEPGIVARGQRFEEPGDKGEQVGTLLMFDLSELDFQGKAMLRMMPVLSWADGQGEHIAVASHEVNLGNITAAIVWTLLVVVATLLLIGLLCARAKHDPRYLLTGADGHLSLAQTQMACWTVAVGSMVLGYGLVQLSVPELPPSLLVLMGAALATGGVGYARDAYLLARALSDPGKAAAAGASSRPSARASGAAAAAAPAQRREPAWGDLLLVFRPGEAPALSLAKAQMVFWTVLLLVLFLTKSILDGRIWEVPWTLVALMGFSQAGYLAPKLSRAKKGTQLETASV